MKSIDSGFLTNIKTKKVPRAFVKAEATEKHPAQVDTYHEDVPVGTWTMVKTASAFPAARVRVLSERVERLIKACKLARETANSVEVEDKKAGEAVLGYLLAP